MKVRILACIQAAILAFSPFQTTAGTISTDNQVLVIEAETETESEEELFSETETLYDMTERYDEEVINEPEDETLEETETKTEIEDVTEPEDKTETEDETETEDAAETETENVAEPETEIEDVTEPEDEIETETRDETETEVKNGIDTDQYLPTVGAAGEKLRESLINRETEITVYYQTTEKPDDEIAKEIWDAALEHTGEPTEGDYILFQYEGFEIPDYEITTAVSTSTENGETSTETIYYLLITYKVTYYTTYEQDTKVEDNTSTENGTEAGADIEAESDLTGKNGQERDERPSITESGVLFPGKKADGFSTVYTGEKICPTMIVTYTYQDSSGKSKTQTLKLNVDYTVIYRNNVEVGGETATVTVKGIGEYQGTVTKEFNITQKSISKVTLSAVGDIKYGEAPKVTVTDGTKELVEGTDYTVNWTEGNANTTTVSTLTVKAVESNSCNYTGTASKKATFNILGSDAGNAISIADARVELKDPKKAYTYSGKAQKPAVVVKDKDGNIISSSNYKILYTNNVNAGTNTAKAYAVGVTKNGAGYYGISEPLEFTINQKSFSKVSASIKGTLPKFGTISDIQNAINDAVVVKDGKTVLSYGEDYTIDYGNIKSSDNIDISTKYEIAISPVEKDGNYVSDTKTLQIKFGQLNLASKTATISLTITNVNEKKVVLMYNGKTLEQDRDYTVASIKQDKKTGLYIVKIKAVNGSAYKGSLTFKEAQLRALSMTLDKALITGEAGETVQLNVTIPSGAQVGTIAWESSNESVATVTDEGLVSMVGSGMAVITASARAIAEAEQLELTAQCQVAVKGKMEDEEFVDITDNGAVPGDGKDDWEAIQGALDDSKNHAAYVPAGIYDIDLTEHNGIVMRRGYKLYMHKDAVLRAMKTDKNECQVINVGSSGHKDDPDYYSNIEISGGTIIGELRETGKDGEGVMGIRVQYAKNIYIHDVTIKECRGDGIYIGGNGKGSTNICITGCTIEDNSRNCLGIVSVHNLYVDNCKISGAGSLFGGKAPRACILIEKNKGDDTCTDIVIKNSDIDNEKVCNSQSEAYAFGSSSARNEIHGDRLTVENCTFKGKVANYSTKNAKFMNCTFDRTPIFKQDTVVQN